MPFVTAPSDVSQPLGDVAALESSIVELCKVTNVTLSDDGAWEYAGDLCSAEVSFQRASVRLWWPKHEATSRKNALDQDARLAAQQADVELLQYLGFDSSEFQNTTTNELVGESQTTDGVFLSKDYFGTKTFVDRVAMGATVGGSRAVVSRNAEGDLLQVTAVWPTLDFQSVIELGDAQIASREAAQALGVALDDIIVVRPTMLIDEQADGHVDFARVRTEVVYWSGGTVEQKPTAQYFADGALEPAP